MEWPPRIGTILLDEEAIASQVTRLGEEITADYQGTEPIMIAVLRGAALFHSDLVREVLLPVKIDFVSLESYGPGTTTSGSVELVKDVEIDVRNQDVVVVEDIVDTGLTLLYLLKLLASRNPSSLRVCSLLSKPSRREVEVSVDYVGAEIGNQFVVGYGLDFNQMYRNLPFVGVLEA